jgi:hypothetical protein
LRWRKPVGEADTPILEELIPPKNFKISQRNQEITNGGLGVTLTVVIQRLGVRSERIVEWVSSDQWVKPMKIGQSGFKRDSPVLSEQTKPFLEYSSLLRISRVLEAFQTRIKK